MGAEGWDEPPVLGRVVLAVLVPTDYFPESFCCLPCIKSCNITLLDFLLKPLKPSRILCKNVFLILISFNLLLK